MNISKTIVGVIALTLLAVQANADEVYVKITGTKSGIFKTANEKKGHQDQFNCFGATYQVVSPRDAASGLAIRYPHGA